jgi:protein-disulfide isomerase
MPLQPPVGEGDHILGPSDAPVTLVEYGDFECPHCGAAYPILQSILDDLGDRIRFVYRHFPLTRSHPHAGRAAEAAEAAAAQGKFWEMHHQLFEHQDALTDGDLIAYAEAIGLDVEAFREALEEGTYEPRVQADFRSGVRSGVNGTPTFFVNGDIYLGRWRDEATFRKTLMTAAERV